MKKYKISEVAKIFNISRETLLYYDKIGILKPDLIDSSNNYRYYFEESITKLGFILILKDFDLSLKEIKEYLESNEKEKSLKVLFKRLEIIEKQLISLEKAKNRVLDEIKEIKETSLTKENFPFLEEIPPQSIFLLPVAMPKGEKELQETLVKLRTYSKNLDVGKRISILKKENLLNGRYLEPEYVGYVLNSSEDNENLPGLFCACILHKKETKKIHETYSVLLNFIKENNFKIIGDVREYFNDCVVNNGKNKGRIVKICIPISNQ